MPRVDSSMIRRIEYDDATRELDIIFTSGKVYTYFDVRRNVYDDFLDAVSKGQFFNAFIKDQYGYR